jgi:hypothetical protein
MPMDREGARQVAGELGECGAWAEELSRGSAVRLCPTAGFDVRAW